MANTEEIMLTTADVTERLSISKYTARDILRKGILKGFKIRSGWRVNPSDLNKFIESGSNRKE